MSLLVVGSVAYDSVQTGAGNRTDSLGGSATYFSVAASYFSAVSLIAVVGEDFRPSDVALMQDHNVDTAGLEQAAGRTFRWSGVYDAEDVNNRETLDTQLNVFADFSPKLSDDHSRQPYLFLANIDPELQLDVLNQMEQRPRLVALDTMNFWIEGKKSELQKVVEAVDVLFIDETEARMFSGQSNLLNAASAITDLGPHTLLIKRGEHGVLLFHDDSVFVAPAFPLETVVDPTGAGDSFAGGFMGYIASTGDISSKGLRRATVLGSVMGSFCVEAFSLERTSALSREQIEERFRAFGGLTDFQRLADDESLPRQ